jgi:hypothetical protein
MRTRDRVSQVILILAALVSAAWAIRNLLQDWTPFDGSAGIGAVSVGVSQLTLLVGVLVMLVAATVLAKAARRHSVVADRYRRAYLWVMRGYVLWAVVSVAWLLLAHGQGVATFYFTIMGMYLVIATFLPVQAFFAISAVAFVIGHPAARDISALPSDE